MEEVYKSKIAFRAIGSYIKDKDDMTYRQIQLEHFYESLLDVGMSEEIPLPIPRHTPFNLSWLLQMV